MPLPDFPDNSTFITILSAEYIPPASSNTLLSLEADNYYLIYCTGGNGRISLGRENGTLLFSPNSLSLLYTEQLSHVTGENESFSCYLYRLSGLVTASYHKLIGNQSFSLLDFPLVKGVLPIFQTLQRIDRHLGSISPLISNKLLTDLFTELFFWQKKEGDTLPGAPTHVADLKNWCDTHFTENFSLEELAENFGVSKYKLCRDFSAYIHISPLQYLNHLRIDHAKNLLMTTNDRIYEIGNAVGIENTNHFINLFKKYTGTTPNEFRHSHPFF